MNTRNPGVELGLTSVAGVSVLVVAQIDCPPQYLIDEFGSLGTLRTMFVFRNSTWRYGV